jgi:hypothetical protein
MTNRGGTGWQEQFGGGRQQGKTDAAADLIVRALKGGKLDTGMISMMAQAGTISQAVLDRVAQKIAGDGALSDAIVFGVDWGIDHSQDFHYGAHLREKAVATPAPAEDEIVMIEIDGVWMSPADAHEARLAIGRR